MTDTGFIKLKNKFVLPEYFPGDATYVFRPGKDFRTLKLDYDDIDNYMVGIWEVQNQEALKEHVLSVIPERYRADFNLNCLRVPHGAPPHIDVDRKCAINFYVSTQGCITKVFNVIGTPKPKNATLKYKYMFVLKDLKEIGSFVSTDGEAYLLNTSLPHQVLPTQQVTDRKMLSLTSKYSFEEVKEMLAETGAI